jgi:hypothetical protein
MIAVVGSTSEAHGWDKADERKPSESTHTRCLLEEAVEEGRSEPAAAVRRGPAEEPARSATRVPAGRIRVQSRERWEGGAGVSRVWQERHCFPFTHALCLHRDREPYFVCERWLSPGMRGPTWFARARVPAAAERPPRQEGPPAAGIGADYQRPRTAHAGACLARYWSDGAESAAPIWSGASPIEYTGAPKRPFKPRPQHFPVPPPRRTHE